MEKEYVKELDRAYLVLGDGQIDEDEYVLQMAVRGRLPGILPLSVVRKDGSKSLRADVTACTSIASRFKSTSLTGSDLRKILSAVRDTARKMPGLLMSVRDLYLDPECVFLGAGGDEVLLCYLPHLSDTEPDSVRLLSEFFLKKLDHSDQAAVSLAYTLFDQVSSESCDLSEILQSLLLGGQDIRPEPREAAVGSRTAASAHQAAGRQDSVHSSPGRGSSAGNRSLHEACVYSAQTEFEEFSRANVKKLPPPAGRKRGVKKQSGAGRPAGRSGHGSKAANPSSGSISRRGRNEFPLRKLLPAAIILPCACIAAVLFQMDLTQICGMGFLCAALIWIIHSSLEKRSNEGRNIWFDEEDDMESDDRFYQSLHKELYADDPPRPDPVFRSSEFPEHREPEDFGSGSGSGAQEDRTRLLRSQVPSLISLKKECCPDIPLNRDHLILGKSRTQADIILSDSTVSRRHARIERRVDGYYVTDLFSTNGTFLDGHRLESGQAVALKDGAQLTIASLPYRVLIPGAA